jgi:hypothetical protein
MPDVYENPFDTLCEHLPEIVEPHDTRPSPSLRQSLTQSLRQSLTQSLTQIDNKYNIYVVGALLTGISFLFYTVYQEADFGL